MASFTAHYMNEIKKALAQIDYSLAGEIVLELAEAWQSGKKIFILAMETVLPLLLILLAIYQN